MEHYSTILDGATNRGYFHQSAHQQVVSDNDDQRRFGPLLRSLGVIKLDDTITSTRPTFYQAGSANCDCNNPKLPDNSYFLAAEYTGIVVLNLCSALFSGLVLGLLSLDITDLEILRKCGTDRERQYAATIIPMRRHSNLLLCSLVLGNVMVNTGLQFLLDRMFSGWISFVSTTVCITIFGEIVPQAVCARYGLAIGAKTIWLTWIVIFLTFPVSYPLSIILDCALGEEIAFVYDRERLQEYIRITKNYNNLDAQEINIITGALRIKKVTIGHVMTKLKDVFMLDVDTIINHHNILFIVKKGFSRIPVFDKDRRKVVGLLMVRDLALVNPNTDVTLKSLLTFYRHPIITVDENHTLDLVLNHFREGKSHMALVKSHRRKEIVGIVTLEDIVEEVLQVEIVDETDVVMDNRELKVRTDAQIPQDLDAIHIRLNDAMNRKRLRDRAMNNLYINAPAPTILPGPTSINPIYKTSKDTSIDKQGRIRLDQTKKKRERSHSK